MARSCVLLLLFLLPFSTGEWSDLVKGLDFYKNLTVGAVGLKQYAIHLSNAVDYIKWEAIDEYLDDNEKEALDELSSGLSQVQEALVKAARGVTVIKERSNALLLVLNLTAIKTEEECRSVYYFMSLYCPSSCMHNHFHVVLLITPCIPINSLSS